MSVTVAFRCGLPDSETQTEAGQDTAQLVTQQRDSARGIAAAIEDDALRGACYEVLQTRTRERDSARGTAVALEQELARLQAEYDTLRVAVWDHWTTRTLAALNGFGPRVTVGDRQLWAAGGFADDGPRPAAGAAR